MVDWFRDSGGSASKREADIILKRIDDLVDIFNRQIEAFDKIYTAADLYFTTNYWLKLVDQGNRTVNKSREPAVFALFKAAVDALCKSYNVSELQCLGEQFAQSPGSCFWARIGRARAEVGSG